MDLSDIHLRGTRAAQPAATTVAAGTLYYVTDETTLERASGIAGGYGVTWESYSAVAGGGGITELTGDVTAGPGSGSVAAAYAGILSPLLGGSGWTPVIAASDQSQNTNTVMINDNELFFTLLANKAYEFEGHIWYSSPAGGGTPDFKFTFNGPATLTGSFTQVNVFNTADTLVAAAATALGSASALGSAATPRLARVFGWCYSTGGGVGSSGCVMQWAQNTSNGNDVTRLANSFLLWRKTTP